MQVISVDRKLEIDLYSHTQQQYINVKEQKRTSIPELCYYAKQPKKV